MGLLDPFFTDDSRREYSRHRHGYGQEENRQSQRHPNLSHRREPLIQMAQLKPHQQDHGEEMVAGNAGKSARLPDSQ